MSRKISVGLSFCVLSRRLKEPHPVISLALLSTLILKIVEIIVKAIEGDFDAAASAEGALLMAEVALLAEAKPRQKQNVSPEEKSSFFSRLFFCWMNEVVRTGASRPLINEDLYPLAEKCTSHSLIEIFDREFQHQKTKQKSTEPTSLVWPFVRSQKKLIITITLSRMVADVVHYLNPLLLKQLIDYVSLKDQPLSFGICIALIMFLSAEIRSMLQNFQVSGMFKLAVYYQSTLQNAILKKPIEPLARFLNHAAVDIEIVIHSIPYLQNTWSVPFQVTLAMTMLWLTLGPPALAGVAVMALFIPLNIFTSKFVKRSQMAQMKAKDERTKLSNELYAWEESFEKKINELRAEEVRLLRNVCVLSRIVDVANAASPFLVAIASFSTFVLLNEPNALTPSVAFVALTIFNQLRQPMRMVANVINTLVQAMVSNKRLKEFMNEDELVRKVETSIGNAVVVREANLNWKGPDAPPVLKNITATVRTNQLVAIVGSVGGGKSSFLSALLDEMNLLSGRIKIGGTIAYVPQQSWIFNKSVKENILFGSPEDPTFYQDVIKSCQLESDLSRLDNGDDTLVGENGITLSGGQKARISLARAVYQDREIYLLDDTLSAVDAHVGHAIFENVIGPNGLLRHKTRLLVTHNLQYTRNVDRIYVIEDGQIVEQGTYDDLKTMGGPFQNLYEEFESKQSEKEKKDGDEENLIDGQVEGAALVKRKLTVDKIKDSDRPKDNKTGVETVQLGRVNKKRLRSLFLPRWDGSIRSAFFLFFMSHFAIMSLRSLWLSDWSNENAESKSNSNVTKISTEFRLAVYAGFGVCEILTLSCAFALLTLGTLRASYGLHAPLIRSLLRAPITFFDITPVGRIINRLSRDLDVIDKLQDSLRMLTQNLFNVVTIMVLLLPKVSMELLPSGLSRR
ncbi:unnamed protein product [Caenorhabditis auriculariae]|uniref:Uncharacterized protein n=1 Tax=Caenorhabditis auriculariae TaxID=2777116 RepID=A0A8S1HP03_9PELO|nr:unnamed protein product [Caenorhabditis auriculariae]